MSRIFACGGAAAAILVVSAQGALADLSAQDVWAEWKAYLTSTGYTVSGTESISGSTLTVSDVSMVMPIPEEDGSGTVSLPEIKFVENGDGTVNLLLPAEFPVGFEFSGDGEEFSGKLLYTHDGAPLTVAGDTENMSYDYRSSKVTVTLAELAADGEAVPDGVANAQVTLNDVTTTTDMKIAEVRTYKQSLSASSLSYDMGFNDPESNGNGSFKGALEGLSFKGTSTVPTGLDAPDMAALLEAGFAFDGTFTFAGGKGSISGQEGSESFAMESSSEGGSVAIAMDNKHLTYDVSQSGTNVNITGSEIPFPLAISMAEAGFNLMMPLAKSEEEQDFALGVTLRDFALPEMLWGMFDPTGQLPHDPATVVLDLAGKGKVLFDMFDPEAMEALEKGEEQPGELHALTVNQLQVSAAGAELTGTGDFTFNNEDLTSFDGVPAPAGEANLKLTGANALIDKLIQMGLITEGDAMGARMMMGMLAVPGEAEDTLTSKIEISEDGQIHANGQRIK
ncbi:DUF2125 domain-containing protein [Leisingera aquaemixtae]|uniref:DUF2125 domain-containing protein n=1 Tax=Leisingera aquaemixtae TaxID=1396826 RepID=UPI0021A30D71|nr:DUF2125 domain-containing protein [Leisingera aquaemixtae]UWQ45478.1 DUF2125 domain-containing protein [Leisingera aquaemixtae]